MYKIVYIDEEEKERRAFQRYCAKFYKGRIEVIPMHPEMPLIGFVHDLIKSGVDAVVADYDLQDKAPNLDYRGNDVVETLIDIRKGFPIFILTNHEPDAEEDTEDLNIIYSKRFMYEFDSYFIDRVVKKIKKYSDTLNEYEKEFNSLNKKKNTEGLNVDEDSRLLKLGLLLESSFNQKMKLPEQLENKANIDVIDNLLENTRALLDEIKKEKKND